MKVGIYNNVRVGSPRFAPFVKDPNLIELIDFPCLPTKENLHLIHENGCEALIFLNDHKEDEDYFAAMKAEGIKYLCTGSAGYDHFNLDAMRKLGIKGANVPDYSPNAVTEHTMLMVLGLLRHIRPQILRVENHDYTLGGLDGTEIRSLTFGVVGAGRIGYTTIRALSGFSPKKIYAYDPYENDKVREYAEYIPLDELFRTCDVIIFHTILNDANYHMVNRETLATMKDGVILINTARGPLFDSDAIVEGVESGKIGALGIDVIEGEGVLKGLKGVDDCPHAAVKKLLTHDNVLFTNHSAFFTAEADRTLVEGTIRNLTEYIQTGSCKYELVK